MKLPAPIVEAFNDSLDLCVADATFFERFYRRFIASSSEVERLFESVPMQRQHRALKASLYTTLMAADGNKPAIEHLRALGAGHARLGIRRKHFQLWLDCLLATVEETPAIESAAVQEAWRRVLELAVEIMLEPAVSGPGSS